MNTEYLPGQLDIEDAIRDAERAETERDVETLRIPIGHPGFRRFVKAAFINPRTRCQLWPHLANRSLAWDANRAQRRRDKAMATKLFEKVGFERLMAEMRRDAA